MFGPGSGVYILHTTETAGIPCIQPDLRLETIASTFFVDCRPQALKIFENPSHCLCMHPFSRLLPPSFLNSVLQFHFYNHVQNLFQLFGVVVIQPFSSSFLFASSCSFVCQPASIVGPLSTWRAQLTSAQHHYNGCHSLRPPSVRLNRPA